MKLDETNDFYSRIYEIVRNIPFGRVSTYGAIAKFAGIGSSARTVGWALNALAGKNTDVPCHRVVNRNGELSGARFFASPTAMSELLINEGIEIIGNKLELEKYFWDPKDFLK